MSPEPPREYRPAGRYHDAGWYYVATDGPRARGNTGNHQRRATETRRQKRARQAYQARGRGLENLALISGVTRRPNESNARLRERANAALSYIGAATHGDDVVIEFRPGFVAVNGQRHRLPKNATAYDAARVLRKAGIAAWPT